MLKMTLFLHNSDFLSNSIRGYFETLIQIYGSKKRQLNTYAPLMRLNWIRYYYFHFENCSFSVFYDNTVIDDWLAAFEYIGFCQAVYWSNGWAYRFHFLYGKESQLLERDILRFNGWRYFGFLGILGVHGFFNN